MKENDFLKKKRLIRVKDPQLAKIRLSLRQILLKESKKRLIDLLEKEKEIIKKHDVMNENVYSKIRLSITIKKNQLRNELSASIVVCAICRDIEKDHIFNPRDKVWYCTKCNNIMEKSYNEELEAVGRVN